MGDLALAAALVAFCFRERWFADLPLPSYGAMFSILLLAAATSKVSLLPVCGLLLCAGGWPLLKSPSPLVRRHVVLAMTLPWIVFYCPIVWWTWTQSGYPLGAILAGVFESPVYSHTWLQKTFQVERDYGQLPLNMIRNAAIGYSPLIWVGAIAALFAPQIPKPQRVILACLLALQSALIYWLLPYDMRFLSLHYGLFIAFASSAPRSIQFRMESSRGMLVACAIFLLPWLAVQSYYARQFFVVSTGLEKYAFYERYVAFYSDYVELDRLLSKDSVLLVPGFRLSAVYSPRPMFFDAADLPAGKPAALFALQGSAHFGASLNGYRIGDQIYENSHAVMRAYRTLGRASVIGQLKIMQLVKD